MAPATVDSVVTTGSSTMLLLALPALLASCRAGEAAPAAAVAAAAAGSNCSAATKPCPGNPTRTFCPTNPDTNVRLQCEGGRAGPPSVTVYTGTVTHRISPLVMGCHSDTGYEHQARGFYAQMIVPDSMNATGFTRAPHWGGNASTDGSFSSARVGWNLGC